MFKVNEVREDFPMLSYHDSQGRKLIYLDNGATTFKPQTVIDAEMGYYTSFNANIHRGDYDLSLQADQAYDQARKTIARFINCQPEEVIFTSGTTESLNMAAYGLKKMLGEGDVILSTLAEHASNILPWFRLAEQTGARVEFIELDEEGRLTVDNFRKALHDRVKIVAIAQITNVLGYCADIKSICALAHQNGAIVVVDGAQSVPHKKTDVKDLDCDLLAFSGHKMCGPTGVGVLYGKTELLEKMEPMLLGGGANKRFNSQGNLILSKVPDKFEAGTVNAGGAAGLHAAIRYLNALGFSEIQRREDKLTALAFAEMQKIPHVHIIGGDTPDAHHGILSFTVDDVHPHDIAAIFNADNVAIRAGHHCAQPLHRHLGIPASARMSIAFYNDESDIEKFVDTLKSIRRRMGYV